MQSQANRSFAARRPASLPALDEPAPSTPGRTKHTGDGRKVGPPHSPPECTPQRPRRTGSAETPRQRRLRRRLSSTPSRASWESGPASARRVRADPHAMAKHRQAFAGRGCGYGCGSSAAQCFCFSRAEPHGFYSPVKPKTWGARPPTHKTWSGKLTARRAKANRSAMAARQSDVDHCGRPNPFATTQIRATIDELEPIRPSQSRQARKQSETESRRSTAAPTGSPARQVAAAGAYPPAAGSHRPEAAEPFLPAAASLTPANSSDRSRKSTSPECPWNSDRNARRRRHWLQHQIEAAARPHPQSAPVAQRPDRPASAKATPPAAPVRRQRQTLPPSVQHN